MKKLFNHTKKPYQKWDEYDRENYDWDEMEEIEEDVEYDASAEEEGAYYADGEYGTEDAEGEYYAEEADGEYFAEEGEMTDAVAAGTYFAEGVEGEEESYYAEEAGEEYYAEEEAEYEEEYYAEEEYYEEEKKIRPTSPKKNGSKKKAGFFAVLWTKFLDMGAMDRVVLATGVGVLVLALITGSVYASARMLDKQVSGFVSVGTQLEGIELIGEQGLLAVADAHVARIAAANSMEHNSSTEYDEEDYNAEVMVGLDLVSVQKDLKIKFTNQRNDKLVANVPFVVTVEDPSGNTENWSDDDMDGIIYKKGLTPGRYQITVNPIEDAKYERYTLPVITETTEVKKEIEYTKIDVKNEIKAETEVNAAKEDTKKNETVVESKLEDTVKWVESTVISNTYKEVSKSTITDPIGLVSRSTFMRMSQDGSGATIENPTDPSTEGETQQPTPEPTAEPTPEPTAEPTQEPTPEPTAEPTPEPTATPTPEPTATPEPAATNTPEPTATPVPTNTSTPAPTPVATATPTATPAVTATPTPSAKPTATPTPTPTPVPVAVEVTEKVSVAVGASTTVETKVKGFVTSKKLDYAAESSDTTKVKATVDDETGKITITGVAAGTATITVKVDYEGNNFAKAATDTIAVTVTGDLSISLDKSALTVLTGSTGTIKASITNNATSAAVTAESSDTGVATVSVDDKTVTVTGVKAGSATITIKYTENGVEVKETCAVTVKTHPQNDTNTRLKDKNGTQLYVMNGSTYREATYADYYVENMKFYVKGDPKYTGWQTLNGKVYFFDSSYKKVTGEQIIQGAKYNFASDGSLMTGSGTMGIDVSKWNGTIDWSAVKNSGISYVIIRSGYRGSSQGALIEDPKFVNNIKGATAAGLKVGIYFFTQAVDEVEAVEEASMVLEQVKGYKISYPIFLDVEPSGGRADGIDKETRTAVIKAFCKTIEDAGYTAGVYANKTWLDSKMNASELSAYKIWLAQYAKEPTYTGRYDLWQYSSTGKVTGISGNVDLNQSYLGY